jgi:hypothetical protein
LQRVSEKPIDKDDVLSFIESDDQSFRQLVFDSLSDLVAVVWISESHCKWAVFAENARNPRLYSDLKELWGRHISERQLNQLFETIGK